MRGVFDDRQMRSFSGLSLLRRVADGELAHAPIYRAIGIRLVEVDEGRAVFEGKPSTRFYNPIGSIHGGYISMLLDSCMGCAVHSLLPIGLSYTTIEIKVNYVRALTKKAGLVRACGSVVHFGRRIATAEGRLLNSSGKLYAHGLSTCVILDLNDGQTPPNTRIEEKVPVSLADR